nr:gastrula zinc finger protein xLCGF3.1 [Parasteatoda tepidariorum]
MVLQVCCYIINPPSSECSPVQSNLQFHLRKKFACQLCGKDFSRKDNLKTHIRVHTGEKPFACPLCGKKFSHLSNMKIHVLTHNDKIFDLLFCIRFIDTIVYVLYCMLANEKIFLKGLDYFGLNEEKSAYICSICSYPRPTLASLRRHMRVHDEVRPFSCQVCHKSFALKGNLKTHLRMHTGERPFSCGLCGKKFTRKYSMKVHFMTHRIEIITTTVSDQLHLCLHCSFTAASVAEFRAHMCEHRRDGQYICTICQKGFSQRGNLTVHMRIHTGERPFECPECGKKFSHKSNMKIHSMIHKKISPMN